MMTIDNHSLNVRQLQSPRTTSTLRPRMGDGTHLVIVPRQPLIRASPSVEAFMTKDATFGLPRMRFKRATISRLAQKILVALHRNR
jgi:hypothetical protein